MVVKDRLDRARIVYTSCIEQMPATCEYQGTYDFSLTVSCSLYALSKPHRQGGKNDGEQEADKSSQ